MASQKSYKFPNHPRLRFLRSGRWPIENPMLRAFCLKAPALRFIVFEILLTGVLALEALTQLFFVGPCP